MSYIIKSEDPSYPEKPSFLAALELRKGGSSGFEFSFEKQDAFVFDGFAEARGMKIYLEGGHYDDGDLSIVPEEEGE